MSSDKEMLCIMFNNLASSNMGLEVTSLGLSAAASTKLVVCYWVAKETPLPRLMALFPQSLPPNVL